MLPKMSQYDIFISYRRSASDFAQLVASHLKSVGYRVFIDVESLRSGKFNTQLFDVIDHCRDFVIILPENGLDRCFAEDDWVRLEYERAEKAGKNIIPIQLNGFVWPSPMPDGMEELSRYQGLSATSAEYYDLSIKRLRGYLKSRPHRLLKKIVSWLVAIVGSILLLFLVAEGVLSIASGPVYTRIADKLTVHTYVLDLLGDSNAEIDKAWEGFVKEYDRPGRETAKEDLFSALDQSMEEVLSGLEPLRKQLGSARIELTPWESLLVSIKDISPEEVTLSEPFVETFFDDIEGRVSIVSFPKKAGASITKWFPAGGIFRTASVSATPRRNMNSSSRKSTLSWNGITTISPREVFRSSRSTRSTSSNSTARHRGLSNSMMVFSSRPGIPLAAMPTGTGQES